MVANRVPTEVTLVVYNHVDDAYDQTLKQFCRSPTKVTSVGDAVGSRVAECGRVTPASVDLIIGNSLAKRGELPWHVGIYQKTLNSHYLKVCSGSLVSSKIVISVAHCFWNDISKQQNASLYAVAIGKIRRLWNSVKDVDAQKSDVKEIKIPVHFQGSAANFQDNIAVLILETAIVYNMYVRPICLDFDVNFERRQLQAGKLGKVASWGLISENGHPSHILKAVVMHYLDSETCITETPPDFTEHMTSDKICAIYQNCTAIYRGDSGSGLAFPEIQQGTERFFLRGIVSIAPGNTHGVNYICSSYRLLAFTQISKHEHFIKEYL